MRNAGHRHFYRRGKVYYFVRGGVWTSLHTTNRKEGLKRLREIEAQFTVAKVVEKLGIKARLDRLENAIGSLGQTKEGASSLAPNSAKTPRGDFEAELENFLNRVPTASTSTGRMYKTARNDLLRTMKAEVGRENSPFAGKDQWQVFEALEPSGWWNALRTNGASNATANHFQAWLRKLLPDCVERGFLAPHLLTNALSIPKLEVPRRQPRIPPPARIKRLLRECEKADPDSGELLRFFAYSGARRGAALDKKTGVTWDRSDFGNRDLVLWQKGDQRDRVPMGPQLYRVLWRRRKRLGGSPTGRVFPYGSTRENKAQAVLKAACAKLGGDLAHMHHFHALKHYFKTTHERAGTPDHISDKLSFNKPAGRAGSGAVYRHDGYKVMRRWVQRVYLDELSFRSALADSSVRIVFDRILALLLSQGTWHRKRHVVERGPRRPKNPALRALLDVYKENPDALNQLADRLGMGEQFGNASLRFERGSVCGRSVANRHTLAERRFIVAAAGAATPADLTNLLPVVRRSWMVFRKATSEGVGL